LFALGRHRETIGELRALVAAHPLREGPHGRLMHALHRTGRRAEALDAYREARRIMVTELGIEPGDELRAIHAEILDGTHLPPAAPASPDRRWTRVAAVALVFVLLLTIQASQPPRSPAAPPPAVAQVRGAVGDGVLTIATLLPMTGRLYFIGAATTAAAELAVQDVNAAGGVLGHPVRLIKADSGDSSDDLAATAVAELIDRCDRRARLHPGVPVGAGRRDRGGHRDDLALEHRRRADGRLRPGPVLPDLRRRLHAGPPDRPARRRGRQPDRRVRRTGGGLRGQPGRRRGGRARPQRRRSGAQDEISGGEDRFL